MTAASTDALDPTLDQVLQAMTGICAPQGPPGEPEIVYGSVVDYIEHGLRVVEAARKSLAGGVGAFVVEGRLVDGPFIARAEHLVALARRLGLLPPNS